MGTCVSSMHVNTTFIKKSKRIKATSVSWRPRRTRRFQRPVNVLKDASGNDILSQYKLGRELGRGEFGVTYECVRIENGEKMACKKISKDKLRTEIDVQDVRREVEIMRRLPNHPNIVSYKDVFEDKEGIYLVMELCGGGELFDRIVAKGHYSERAAAVVTKTMLEVIKVCHENGVMHRDLKPENFLYANKDENSPLKAIDFGLSIFFEPGQNFKEIVGSPYYMAPEVLRRNYGPEVDIWSSGVILYILLCGVPPFWAETEQGIAQAIVKGKLTFKRAPWPKVSEDAKELVKGMLDPNPFSRMTIEEVLGHRWIQNAHKVPDIPLGNDVRTRIKQFSLMNKFKKKVLGVVATTLPDEQIQEIREMFHMWDTDKNGDLTLEELKSGLISNDHNVSDLDVQSLMEAADLDGNGTLNIDEFVTIAVHIKKISSDEQLKQAFSSFDKNQSGYIEFEELNEALFEGNQESNNENVIREIIFDADLDKDGRISYPEFAAMMKTGMDWKMASRQYSRVMLNALSKKMFKENPVQTKMK
ncbi:putative EF-hand domain pair, Serine/threonine protein kinase, striated muscle-specific [Heracleum sosnowskyi]|uniref:non-specific serine/threonine protein kinase n=1 Tax=Heracleum sosnowskyi TaxID=360622 RepID=A0AAD8HTZ6_9APIA|nr:putative EF-hand domain pair, Serine/threonine protein kinase, striated muscle-specific [Heracleum sosnowskyi]